MERIHLPSLKPEEFATLQQALAVAESVYRGCEDAYPGALLDSYRQRAIDVRLLRRLLEPADLRVTCHICGLTVKTSETCERCEGRTA